MPWVYGIHNLVSDKWYVGQSTSIERRQYTHFSQLRKNKHANPHLQRAWNKYGEGSFEFVRLECVEDAVRLAEREEFWVSEKRKLGGVYNQRVAAVSNLGMRHSLETRAKISASQMGRKYSPEWCANISASLKGRKPSPEQLIKMSSAKKGKKHSLETRVKMSASGKGRKCSYETRVKLSVANKGKKHSSETRAKLSAAWTPERRAKQAAINKNKKYPTHTKLTHDQVTEIRQNRFSTAGNKLSVKDLAKKFNVCTGTIRNVLRGKTWRGV